MGWVTFWEVPRKCVSEDKNTLESLVLVCGDSRQNLDKLSGCYKWYQSQTSPNTVWFEDEPGGSWWACDVPGTDEGGEWSPVHEA